MVVVMALTAVPLGSLIGIDLSGIDLLTGKAKAYSEGPYTYKLENGGAIITKYTDVAVGDIVIPEDFDGYMVTGIGDYLFYCCERLTNIVIPSAVKAIGDFAFYGCRSLETVKMGNNVETIGERVFENCKALESINLSNKLKSINYESFVGCENLKHITIPDSVETIEWAAFTWTSLESVIIPKSVLSIEGTAFKTNTLKKITILNKNCDLQDGSIISSEVTIYGYQNSTAWEYALENGCKFVPFCTNGHNYTDLKQQKATTTQDGYKMGTCATCTFVENTTIPKVASFALSATTYAYDGTVKTPSVTVKDSKGNALRSGTDYTVSYDEGRTEPGKYNVTVTLTGDYSGSKTLSFSIVKPVATSFTLSATRYNYDGKVKTPTVTVKDNFGKTLRNGTDYTLTYAPGRKTPGKYSVTVNLKGVYSGSKTLYFTILPGKTSKLTATQTASSVKATWKAVTGADGYKVTLYSAKNKAVKTVYTTKTSYTFSKLSKGTTYKVRVTAYKTIDGKKVYAGGYTQLTTVTKPGTPSLTVSAGTKKASLRWNKQTGASGYAVYMATSKNGKFSKIATLKGNSKISFTKTGLTKGKTYYFKVAAYSTVSGKTLYGSYSLVKAVKVK